LLQQCTKDGLLYGGPHLTARNAPPSVHHTFCHSKALTTILDHPYTNSVTDTSKAALPRDQAYGVRAFSDIQTWLIAKGKYRATVTGYDREYKKTVNGHASGGALTMLWHEKAGILLAASMNEYQLFEAGNMQAQEDPLSMPLTPRMELTLDGALYMNISDLSVSIEAEEKDTITVKTKSRLVDRNQQSPPSGEVHCEVTYTFNDEKVTLLFRHDSAAHNGQIKTIVPLISLSTEKVSKISKRHWKIQKDNAVVVITASDDIIMLPTTGGRVFNFVPGLEAIPTAFKGNDVTLAITVKS
jgi:hypothetical protein